MGPRANFEEDLVLAVGGVVCGYVGGHLPDVLREVAEDGLDLVYGIGVIFGDVIHDTGNDGVDLCPAQHELVDTVTQGPLDEGRTSGEDAGGLGHYAEVGDDESGAGNARAGAHSCGHYGDLSHQLVGRIDIDAADEGRGARVSFPADAASYAFHKHYKGDAVFVGEILNEAGHAALEPVMVDLKYTAFDGEVLSAYGNVPAIDLPEAHDVAGSGVWKAVADGVEALMDGYGTNFEEGTGVCDVIDTLSDGPTTCSTLPGDGLRASELKSALPGLDELGSGCFPCESRRWRLRGSGGFIH